jgi:signal-transduction protein with cAMP-binding, CBS, and nucleotidyltransferase domain
MKENHVGALVVNDKEGLFILTEQDIVRKAVASGLDPKKAKVADVMTKADYVVEPQQDIFEALVIMRDFNVRHLPVVDSKKMIGLLTLKDVLKIEPQLFDLMVEKFELREEERKPLKMKPKSTEGVCNLCGNYAESLFEKDGVMVCEECAQE